ncbi:MAG: Cof-type HAD-IIB family hydrolase [Defluviitaleaceae bacterium]|nr:Cof-type HAD-IIB family hydrolase [Defluviitaleaceae bacterium]
MKIKMIVSDLDNTLLRTDKSISQYTLEVLENCRKQGILLAYATARAKSASEPFVDEAKPDIIISDSGALIRMGDEVIHRAVMPKETINKIMKILHSGERVGYITASTDIGLLVNYDVDPNDESWKVWKPVHVDFAAGLNHDIYKLSPEITEARMRDEIMALSGISYIPFHGENWCHIGSEGITKWTAIEKIAQHLNIGIQSIVAFGDDYSDIEMIRGCGIGVAMGNANDDVKAAADQLCDTCDNDGVAKWLEENLCI